MESIDMLTPPRRITRQNKISIGLQVAGEPRRVTLAVPLTESMSCIPYTAPLRQLRP